MSISLWSVTRKVGGQPLTYLLFSAGRNIRLCRTTKSRTSFPGFRPEPSAMLKSNRPSARKHGASTSTPSFLPTVLKPPIRTTIWPVSEGLPPAPSTQDAKIVSLGGFSSILIEGNLDQLPERHDTVFTTGNTLTVGLIVQGIKKICALEGRNIRQSTLLIVGATGDVGSGCARCLAPIVKRVLLSARNVERLRKLAAELAANEVQVEIATGRSNEAILRNGRPRDLRGESAVSVASIGSHRPRRNRLRCGLSQEPLAQRADARRQNLLRRSGTNHKWHEIRAGFSWGSQSASLP